MFRRRILNTTATPLARHLLTPFLYYCVNPPNAIDTTAINFFSASCAATRTSSRRNCSSVSHARRSHHTLAALHSSTLLRSAGTATFTGNNSKSLEGALLPSSSFSPAHTMSQDGVEVPCSTQLTIGDVVIPIPDFARHPERVAWAAPGVDHTAPYLHKSFRATAATVSSGAGLPLPSFHAGTDDVGGGAEEENMFFSVKDPLTRSYLRWIAQKEQLGQDMCLIGDPGPAMRWLVMLYSHLTRREIRVVYLNSDITESDLKQRREIRNGSLIYDDQSAVSAAVEGQLLVLEGLERVERNVLPVVNNLLENREMHLDNGSVLIHPARYDSLLQKLYESKLQKHNMPQQQQQLHEGPDATRRAELMAEAKHELAQMGLVRVSEKFRVIGITVPVPPYDGNPLDPPLRSRFQCLYVRTPLPVVAASSSMVGALQAAPPGVPSSRKRTKDVTELQELQSVRFAQVAQLRAAITAINDSTRDFQLSRPGKKKKKNSAAKRSTAAEAGRYRNMYHSGDVVAEMFRDEEGGADDVDEDSDNVGGDRGASGGDHGGAAASSPLQTVGHWALATIAQQLALFPDLPVGEAVVRGFPWPLYARQLTRGGGGGGGGGAATGYASVAEYHTRLAQYAEVLQHCHVYPPLLLAGDLAEPSNQRTPHRTHNDHSGHPRRSSSSGSGRAGEPSAKLSKVSARLRTVMQGSGEPAGSGEPPSAAAARAYIRSAQLVPATSTSTAPDVAAANGSTVPAAIQQVCNYIVAFRHATTTATFSGVPVVVAEAVVATAAHDSARPGEAGTYTLPVFLGAAALPSNFTSAGASSGSTAAAEPQAQPWERQVEAYLASTAAPSTVFTTEHFHVLQTMLQVHASRQHLCLLGPTGCGKTAMVRAFGRLLGYEEMLTMHLYADMTNKDLFQQRMTDPKTGNTTWQDSPLLHAAIYGKLVVLDGMEKLPSGMLSSLQQLLVDQSAVLADGTILKPPTEYTLLKEQLAQRDPHTGAVTWQPTDAEMRQRKIFPVHPAFRVVATARPPVPVSGGGGGGGAGGSRGMRDFFITHDLTTLFRTVAMPDAGDDALGPVLRQVAEAEVRVLAAETWRTREEGGVASMRQRSHAVVDQLLQLRTALEALHAADAKMPQLSLRQLRQLVRSAVRYPSRVAESVRNTLLLPLMTGVAATKVRHALEECGLVPAEEGSGIRSAASAATTAGRRAEPRSPRVTTADDEELSRAATTPSDAQESTTETTTASTDRVWSVNGEPVLKLSRVYTQQELALVPFVTGFHANRVHESILAWLAKQYAMRSNILLIGNQGVGKNKVVDAFLSRLAIPRHYIQLHRDTTVGSLTINPTVEAGRVVWEDSPLVKAVQQGHCLVVDEIDKAPVEVVQVLKGLIEDREMRLGDGRQIYDPALEHHTSSNATEISRYTTRNDNSHASADTASSGVTAGDRSGGSETGNAAVPSAATQRIAIHPDFRIIVLANPPGFPFHGNDFFRECGDLFAAYVMSNPDAASQLRVLSAYAPTLPRQVLERLVAVFMELQSAFTQGNLTYPFSLRELIAVVKHMSRYPQDGVYGALNNVFNFDARDENTLRLVRQVLGHYLQPMVQHGGLQRLRPYRAGEPVALVPFKNLVPLKLPTSAAEEAGPSSSSSAVLALPAEVTADAGEVLARIAQEEKTRRTLQPATWSATYATEDFFPSSASAAGAPQSSSLSESFTEWVSQCTLPFVDPSTDTVLSTTAFNALGSGVGSSNGSAEDVEAETALPLVSVLLRRRGPATNPTTTTRSESARLIVATVRLPPSPLDSRHLVADTAEELATLWPVGHTRFVDVSAYYPDEDRTRSGDAADFTFAALRMGHQRLPWTTVVSADVSGGAEDAVYTWPPSLSSASSAYASAGIGASQRRSLFDPAGLDVSGVSERMPQSTLFLSSASSGTAVLLDVLAGAASDLYLSRMGLAKSQATKTSTPRAPVDTAAGVLNERIEGSGARSASSLSLVLPLCLEQLAEKNSTRTNASSENRPAASHTTRILDVNTTSGAIAFTCTASTDTAALSNACCCFLMGGYVVRVTLPQPVASLRFVGAHTAVVTLMNKPGSVELKGILKVALTADGAAQAAFLPLPADAARLELVEVADSADLVLPSASGKLLSPADLANSVWRVVPGGSTASTQPAPQVSQSQPQQGQNPAADAEDPAGQNVVYARAEGVTDAGLQLRYFKNTTSTPVPVSSFGTGGEAVVVDAARHQLLQMHPDGATVTAVDTQRGTLRTFARLPGAAATSTSPASRVGCQGDRLSVDRGSGTAYAWNSATQRLSVADVDVSRVRQRYAAWSNLLSGSADTVGDAATTEDGDAAVRDFKMKYSTPRKQPSGTLKHGEVDDKEHHGGNTWAGGTGGTDTAGLGGMVGPYRLDKGNEVHQVSPEEKRKVPQHLLDEARRMGREALKERLQAIGMTEAEYEEYKRLQDRVRPAVAQLRTLLMGLKAAEGERVWVTGQTDGVWDDKKLVEGIVGEKNVYKRRVDSKETNPFQQKHKKRLVFVLDVSASMYRFNGMDQRLTKLLETTVMVMEAFAGFEAKLDYAMIGHNGDSEEIPLVNFGAPPANQKERMIICQKMIAYAQYCWAGDNTVEAMRRSVELVTKEKGDSYFVFVVSDANLQRYGITPRELSEIIQSKPEVKMFCIFIATLGAQASNLQRQLPAGHGYECMRTDALPQVMRQIFTSANLF